MFIHDIIKREYVRQGYLPNYPYHLISDKEMFDAFLTFKMDTSNIEHEKLIVSSDCYFGNYYKCNVDSLSYEYKELVLAIQYHIDKYLDSLNSYDVIYLPNWVYSYMVGSVICEKSNQLDRHDMLMMLNLDNIEDEITDEVMISCLNVSKNWLKKFSADKLKHRPPTMFGEPHVLKSLRISQSNI